MPHPIRITVDKIEIDAQLSDTPAALALWEALPIERTVNTWGHEFYFDIGIRIENSAEASDIVEVGDIAYWPPGSALCIFFGRTPASQGQEIRAASPVTVLGTLIDTPTDKLRRVRTGTSIRIESKDIILRDSF
ncbi:MAG TPA: hypothetical protein DGO43_09800 [Chloroflexi bacterium]|nr:hypothetical protein [Chloroflexota bacterium]|tara:strand:+ start:366 stop:767 length:402 start_codon:yes stop_codon:yes gene_type:complete